MKRKRATGGIGAGALAVWLLAVVPAAAQDAADDFRQNCLNCHTIGGGDLAGPDLKNVEQRRDRQWLVSFIQNPQAAMDAGDPAAIELRDRFNGLVMPTVSGMTSERATALLDLIAAESQNPESPFVGLRIGEQPLTAADAAKGRRLFLGLDPLTNGGPACGSCHAVQGTGGFGGGRLGPDLTRVYERIQGRAALAAWLQAPPTMTMKPLFANRALTNDEILALVAHIEQGAAMGGQAPTSGRLPFLLLGLAGALVGLTTFNQIWRTRFRAVRRPLVHRHGSER